MHRSRFAGIIIDCQGADVERAAAFWSRALGYPTLPSTDPADAAYVRLETAPRDLHVEVQEVEHPSRVHLDIEADDVEAEVRRLEKLGARRVEQVRSWWVMEAPTGHRFCVVQAQGAGFAETAKEWE